MMDVMGQNLLINQVRYQYETEAFHYDLRVECGQCLGLIGPSGSGKSTLLALIAGFIQPLTGEIYVGDQAITNLDPAKRPISMVFQDYNLFAHLTLGDNVALGLMGNLRLTMAQWQQVEQALADVELEDFFSRLPETLSGGQRSRAALARALLRRRPILLLDEPLAALGPAQRQQMLKLLAQLKQRDQLTMIMVSHQPDEITSLCDQLAFVHEGHIAWQGTPQALLEESLPAALHDYLKISE